MKRKKNAPTFITILLFLFVSLVTKAEAATFTVTNTNDSGDGSLRQAVSTANSNNEDDTIVFDTNVFASPQTIFLTSGEMRILPDNLSGAPKTLLIVAPGPHRLTLDGNNQSRIFYIERFALLAIEGVTVTKGRPTGGFSTVGGGILVDGGSLSISNSHITDNFGDGLFVVGNLNATNISVTNHTAGQGEGIYLYFGSTGVINNSTISGNKLGINNYVGQLELNNCTIAHNGFPESVQPAGVYNSSFGVNSGHSYIRNTIIANNISTYVYPDINNIFITSRGHNIIGSNVFMGNTGDQMNVNPQLDPVLRNNGGNLPTHALRRNSTAIDAGNNCVLNTPNGGGCMSPPILNDQRGRERSADGDGNGFATVDIGAFEVLTNEALLTPGQPDLQSESDSGRSSIDNITRNQNLSFAISGLVSGATVDLMRNGVIMSSVTSKGANVVLTDANAPANGIYQYSVRQTVNGVTGLQSAPLSVTLDNTAPSVILNQNTNQPDPTNTQSFGFFIAFSEPVERITEGSISLAGSTANVSNVNYTIIGEGAYYGLALSNVTSDGLVRASIVPDTTTDIAGNANIASTSTDNTITFDSTPPTVTINQASGQADPTANSFVNFTVVFSEPVTGFNNSDVSLTGSTANVSSAFISVSGNGTTYSVSISNFTSNGQVIRASVNGGGAQDVAGNLNTASTSTDNSITVDNIAPTVTINQSSEQPDPASAQPINFTVTFSEPVTGFTRSGVSLTGSTANVSNANIVITGSGATYRVAISNVTSEGVVRARILPFSANDIAGNFNSASTSLDNIVTVTIPPFAQISGRVTTALGRGATYTRIIVTTSTGQEILTQTNPFGYYRFNNIETGMVTIRISAKNRQSQTQTFFLTGNTSELNYVLQ